MELPTTSNLTPLVTVVDTEVSDSDFAFYSLGISNLYPVQLAATRCVVTRSSEAMHAENGGQIIADGCTVNGNTTAFFTNNGTIYSRGNNTVFGNTNVGATPTSFSAK